MNSTHNYNILIVDDIADNLLLMQLLLEIEGYRVETAHSGTDAIAKIQTSPPDLVLLDVMMPGMNGFEVTQNLRDDQNFVSLPILLITADRDADPDQAQAVGATDLIFKPIDMDDLLSMVRTWCDLGQTSR